MRRAVCIVVFTCLAWAPTAGAQTVSQAMLSMVAARASQDGTVNSIEAMPTTAAAAALAINPQTTHQPEADATVPVTLFVMHGTFEDASAPVPPGGSAPRGSVLAYIVNENNEVAASYIGNEAVPLGKEAVPLTGAVQQFRSPKDHAIITRARHELPKAPRARIATWGKNCKLEPPSHHCHVQAEWWMTGGEQVAGSYQNVDTTVMDVPDSEDGAFVSNEQWTSMEGHNIENAWMEIGNIGGNYHGCCELWWFWAVKYPGAGLTVYDGPPYVGPASPENDFGIVNYGSRVWCNKEGPSLEVLQYCYGGWPSNTSTLLQAGAEVSDEVIPSFSALQHVAGQHLNGVWYNWNFAEVSNESPGGGSVLGLCWGQLSGQPAGDIYYGTC